MKTLLAALVLCASFAAAQTPVVGVNSGASGSAPAAWAFYGNGNEGALNLTTATPLGIYGEHWYSSITIAAVGKIQLPSTSTLILRSQGACVIHGTISVSPNSGSAGQTAAWGGGCGGGGGGGTAAGAAGASMTNGCTGGAAGAAAGGAGGNSSGPTATPYQNFIYSGLMPQITTQVLFYGGTNGGGGGSTGPAGGRGGGALILTCGGPITFDGSIDASGGVGAASTGANIGASGGGGGGLVIMNGQGYPVNTGTINVTGGAGGSCGANTGCGAGGAGSNGNSIQFTHN